MTRWTIVLWLLSVGWNVRCQEEVTGSSLERLLQSPGMLDNSESELAQMIAKALAAKSQEDTKPITSGHVAKLLEDATPESSSSHELMTKTGVTVTDVEPDVSGTTPDDIMSKDQENEIIYEPVVLGQFGEPGEGSKFLEEIQNFDFYKYIGETDGDFSTLAEIGVAALLTIGAIAAVPVAPLILRRTGTSGWGGLPSFSELWGWWSEPDPVAEKFANSDYNDNYLNRPHQRQKGRPNKNRGKRPNQQTSQRPYQQTSQRPYQQTAQRPYQQYAEEEDAYEYDYYYYDSASSPININQQYELDSEPSTPSAQAPNEQYIRPISEHVRLPHHSGNHHPVGHNRRQNKHGHEYTTVEELELRCSERGILCLRQFPADVRQCRADVRQCRTDKRLNTLGDQSLKTINEQFSKHMQNRDNVLKRRYDEHAYMDRHGQVMENTQKISQNYLNNHRLLESEEMVKDEPTRYSHVLNKMF